MPGGEWLQAGMPTAWTREEAALLTQRVVVTPLPEEIRGTTEGPCFETATRENALDIAEAVHPSGGVGRTVAVRPVMAGPERDAPAWSHRVLRFATAAAEWSRPLLGHWQADLFKAARGLAGVNGLIESLLSDVEAERRTSWQTLLRLRLDEHHLARDLTADRLKKMILEEKNAGRVSQAIRALGEVDFAGLHKLMLEAYDRNPTTAIDRFWPHAELFGSLMTGLLERRPEMLRLALGQNRQEVIPPCGEAGGRTMPFRYCPISLMLGAKVASQYASLALAGRISAAVRTEPFCLDYWLQQIARVPQENRELVRKALWQDLFRSEPAGDPGLLPALTVPFQGGLPAAYSVLSPGQMSTAINRTRPGGLRILADILCAKNLWPEKFRPGILRPAPLRAGSPSPDTLMSLPMDARQWAWISAYVETASPQEDLSWINAAGLPIDTYDLARRLLQGGVRLSQSYFPPDYFLSKNFRGLKLTESAVPSLLNLAETHFDSTIRLVAWHEIGDYFLHVPDVRATLLRIDRAGDSDPFVRQYIHSLLSKSHA